MAVSTFVKVLVFIVCSFVFFLLLLFTESTRALVIFEPLDMYYVSEVLSISVEKKLGQPKIDKIHAINRAAWVCELLV
jgi:hypothetical protein